MFLDLKAVAERCNNRVFGLCQQTSNVECTYLLYKNLKINRKEKKQ